MDIRKSLNLLGHDQKPTITETPGERKYTFLIETSLFSMAYRSWFNPDGEQWHKVSPSGSHVKDVLANPEAFGLTAEDLAGGTDRDRDPVVMDAMCGRGWIRIAAAERNDPGKFMIIEGRSLQRMTDVASEFYYAFKGRIGAMTLKVRGTSGNREYSFQGQDQVKDFIEGGQLTKPIQTTKDDTLKQ